MSFKYRFIVSFVLLEIFFILLIVTMNFIAINNSSNKLTNQNIQSNITFLDELLKIPLSIYDIATIDNLVLKATNLDYIDSIIVLDSQNKIISKDYSFKYMKLNELLKIDNSFSFEKNNDYYEIKINEIKEGKLTLGKMFIIFDTSENKQFITNNKNNTILIILLEIFLSTLLSYIIGSKITNKLTKLSEVAAEIGKNKNPEIPYITSKNEMGILAKSLTKMQKDLKQRSDKLKELAKTLKKQKNELIQAHRAKDIFLANMSHELKTPLNSINVISAVMMKNKQNRLDDEYQKNMSVINRCGKDLLYLINDILDISKLEAKEITLDYSLININDFINEIDEMFRPQVVQKGLIFKVSCDCMRETVSIDKNRLNQIVRNLLSNALKFTYSGKIELLVNNKSDFFEIIVKDEGIGIAQNKLEHIFDRFKQADSTTTRKYGGTGLGLAISKELCKLMNGDINVKSQENVGTVFTVTISKNNSKISKPKINDVLVQKDTKVLVMNKNSGEKNINNIYILNNDPVLFLNIVTQLNKEFKVKQALNIEAFKELIVDIKEKDLLVLCLDKTNLSDLKELNLSNAIIISEDKKLSENLNKPFKKFFEKNKVKDNLLTYIKEYS